ncbi:hypothetical protein [Endozoicomonas numazuensis]|nr:hypothetical protein [Endozoicomonas numazuensis]
MQQQFDHWVSGQEQTVAQLWPGLVATVLFLANTAEEAISLKGP